MTRAAKSSRAHVLQAARPSAPDLAALGAVSDAAQADAGLAELLRAASRALGISLLLDRSSSVLAVAARSPSEKRSLWRGREGVSTVGLKRGDSVGRLRRVPLATPRLTACFCGSSRP
ncbi:MAG: hypothetical protein ACLP8S_30910 [Solirubrobacteraceae bacterium]